MKLLKQGLALAVVGAGLVATPFVPVQAQPTGPDSLIARIKAEARGSVAATRSDATGRIGFLAVKGEGDLLPGIEADSRRSAVAKAEAYLDEYAAAFGARPTELQRQRVVSGTHGTTVTYTQSHRGVEVFGSTLKVNVDAEGDLTAVSGFAAPDLSLSVTPRASAQDIGRIAVAWVKADPPTRAEGSGTVDTTGLRAVDPTLVVYRTGVTRGEPGKAVLAYRVEVTNGSNIRDLLFFDADTKKILNRWTLVHDALDRELYELSPSSEPVWSEGDPFPADLNDDQQNLVSSASESYWLFANAFGRDSYDGAGATMRTVNNDPTIDCPNANWNGETTNYCDGVTSDDVVSHEWGHAYTQFTSGLIYQYQSGALNESYSDVWGETLDLINGREDEGESFEGRRTMTCESTSPAALSMSITAPAAVAGPCLAVEAAFGEGFGTSPVTPQVVVALDAADPAGPSTTDGCSAYTNAAEVAGSFAYVDRGTCGFQQKVTLAESAGATGIVVGNNNVDYPSGMSGTADIPGVMVSQADGARFKAAGTATVSIAAEDTSTREVSSRWTVGEKSSAFGGAIRDMWMPTCQGDPGKVSDAEYKCDPTLADSGGVHSNSGVPNHAYALTVDGGDYNGESITGIGLDKAANIWWRAQSAYLVPTSNFVDAADALEQSCTDLTGQPINALTTAPEAGPQPTDPIVADDCAQLAAALAAVEMREDPERCDFQPVLDPNAPSLCGEGWVTETIWSEDFEDGLDGWTKAQELASWPDYDEFGDYVGGFGQEWAPVAASDVPGDHDSAVARGPAPTGVGVCSGNGVDDFSSRDSLISPVIELPGSLTTPRLTFDHYVATEALYDGGNVKVSINNGPFEVVPATAYLFNAPGELATLEEGNTNPLGGEAGFTGVDGGQSKGSWGQSQIDVEALGVTPGDTLQLRFDIGRDGCGGVDGWYVDNVELVECALPVTVTASHRPDPSTFGTPSSVEVEVARDGSAGATPTGTVTVTDSGGTEVGTAELSRGRASVALPADLPVGVHVMTASYAGSSTLAAASTEVTVTVVAPGEPTPVPTETPGPTPRPTPTTPPGPTAGPTPGPPPTTPPVPTPTTGPDEIDSDTRAKVRPKTPRRGRDFRVVVRVRADEGTATGRVVVKVDGKKVGSGRLKNGRLVVKVSTRLAMGKHRLVATYLGSETVDRSRDKVTFRVRR